MNYWLFGDYVGVGAGAHGKVSLGLPEKILRTVKPKQPRDYQDRIARAAIAVGEESYIAAADLPFEFMLNALRLNDGFSVAVTGRGPALTLNFSMKSSCAPRLADCSNPVPKVGAPRSWAGAFSMICRPVSWPRVYAHGPACPAQSETYSTLHLQ